MALHQITCLCSNQPGAPSLNLPKGSPRGMSKVGKGLIAAGCDGIQGQIPSTRHPCGVLTGPTLRRPHEDYIGENKSPTVEVGEQIWRQ